MSKGVINVTQLNRATFNCVGVGCFFYFPTDYKVNVDRGAMCVRISPMLYGHDTYNSYSVKVNYFNIREKKFGYLSELEEVEIPNKAYKDSIIKMFGIEH